MAEDEWAELRGVVAARVLGRSPELTKDLAEHLTAVLDDDLTRDPEIQRLLMQLAHNTIVESMGAMPDLSPPPQARTLAAAIALGRLLATHGVPACTTDQVFHVAQAWWQDAVLREFGRAQPTASPMGMLAPVMNWQLRGFLGMADAAGQEHAAVMDTWRQQSSSSLSSRVSFVLADVEVASEAEDVLHYAMSGRHLGLVIWSSRGNVQSSRLKQLVIDLGADHGVVETLVASRDVSSVYAWLSLTGSPRPAIAGLTRRISEMRDVRVGVGEPQAGLAGFKATHEQALVARRLAQYPGSQKRRVIRYHDIAAATLLVKHPEDADPWTAEILGGLAGPGQDVERLRETLRVYLESGENASRAAVQLYVHRNTVKYRVASALELLGVPLEHNRLSVALALNYHHVAMGHD